MAANDDGWPSASRQENCAKEGVEKSVGSVLTTTSKGTSNKSTNNFVCVCSFSRGSYVHSAYNSSLIRSKFGSLEFLAGGSF